MRILALLFLLCGIASAEDECESVLVESIEGEGAQYYLPEESREAHSLEQNQLLEIGTEIQTDSSSTVDLRMCDGTGVRVGVNSNFKILDIVRKDTFYLRGFELIEGSVRAIVNPESDKHHVKFRLKTETASLGVRGTEFFTEFFKSTGETSLYTLDGDVLLGENKSYELLEQPTLKKNAFESVQKNLFSRIKRSQKRPDKPIGFAVEKLKGKRSFGKQFNLGKRQDFSLRVKKFRQNRRQKIRNQASGRQGAIKPHERAKFQRKQRTR